LLVSRLEGNSLEKLCRLHPESTAEANQRVEPGDLTTSKQLAHLGSMQLRELSQFFLRVPRLLQAMRQILGEALGDLVSHKTAVFRSARL
jgi:hypothetical protein